MRFFSKTKAMLLTALAGAPMMASTVTAVHADTVNNTTTIKDTVKANSVATIRKQMIAQGLNINDVDGKYVVRPGDTLSGIAAAAKMTVSQIVSENHLTNADAIYVGQVLWLDANATGMTNNMTMNNSINHAVTSAAPIASAAALNDLHNYVTSNYEGTGNVVALPSKTVAQMQATALANNGINFNNHVAETPVAANNHVAPVTTGYQPSNVTDNHQAMTSANGTVNNPAGSNATASHASSAAATSTANKTSQATSAANKPVSNASKTNSTSAANKTSQAASDANKAVSNANKTSSTAVSHASSATATSTANKTSQTASAASNANKTNSQAAASQASQASATSTANKTSQATSAANKPVSNVTANSAATSTASQASQTSQASQASAAHSAASQAPNYDNGVVNSNGTVNYQNAMNQKGPWDNESSATDTNGDSPASDTWFKDHPNAKYTYQGYADGSQSRTPVYAGDNSDLQTKERPTFNQNQCDQINSQFQKDTNASQTFGNGITWVSNNYNGQVTGQAHFDVDTPVATPYQNTINHTAQIDSNSIKQCYNPSAKNTNWMNPAAGTMQTPAGSKYVSSNVTQGQGASDDGCNYNTVHLTFYK